MLGNEGRADYGPLVDCYAFGVVLWQLFTSLQPYADLRHNRFLLLHKIAKDGLRPSIPQWLPSSVECLIRECWSEAEHLRPTANELVQRLLAVQVVNRVELEGQETGSATRQKSSLSLASGEPPRMLSVYRQETA